MYVIKVGEFYLENYYINKGAINTDFIESVYFTNDLSDSIEFDNEEQANEIRKKLYVLLGVNGSVEQIERSIECPIVED